MGEGVVTDLFYFSDWVDLAFGGIGLLMGILLLVWWRQQSERWYAIFAGLLFLATLLDVLAFYLFVVPPHQAGCIPACVGHLGYPLPYAVVDLTGAVDLFPGDFLLNLLLLWLVLMVAAALLRFLSESMDLDRRSRRFRVLFYLIVVILPWALLPRYVAPPEASVRGEELRLSVNARRAAEMTYGVTGLWIQRLALEDIRYTPLQVPGVFGGVDQPQAQVCLRGYTYFYLPWRRYRITLDRSGVTALNMTPVPLVGSCWE